MQLEVLTQDTACSPLFTVPSSALGMTDQLVPFQVSTRVFPTAPTDSPTATHEVALMHETPWRRELAPGGVTGLGTMDH
jgi:hypothetical protein